MRRARPLNPRSIRPGSAETSLVHRIQSSTQAIRLIAQLPEVASQGAQMVAEQTCDALKRLRRAAGNRPHSIDLRLQGAQLLCRLGVTGNEGIDSAFARAKERLRVALRKFAPRLEIERIQDESASASRASGAIQGICPDFAEIHPDYTLNSAIRAAMAAACFLWPERPIAATNRHHRCRPVQRRARHPDHVPCLKSAGPPKPGRGHRPRRMPNGHCREAGGLTSRPARHRGPRTAQPRISNSTRATERARGWRAVHRSPPSWRWLPPAQRRRRRQFH